MPNTRKIHDYKIIALSLVFLVSIFDKVMVVLRKKNKKNKERNQLCYQAYNLTKCCTWS